MKGRHVSEELNLAELTTDEYEARVADAIDLASDQDKITWLTVGGKHIAAIVPVEVAEAHERMMAKVLAAQFGGEPLFPDVRVHSSILRDGDTATLLSVVLGALRARGVSLRDLREFRQAVFDAGGYTQALALAEQAVTFE
jgi:hypothetical protein